MVNRRCAMEQAEGPPYRVREVGDQREWRGHAARGQSWHDGQNAPEGLAPAAAGPRGDRRHLAPRRRLGGAPTPTPSPTLPPQTPAPSPTPGPPVLPEAETALKDVVELQRVARLVGEGACNDTVTRFGLHGADLGSMFDDGETLYMVFGDSFGCCIPGTGGPGDASDWRSNCMALISDRDPKDGLTFDDMITDRPGHAKELLHAGSADRTLIPTYGVAVGSRLYLHYMAVLSWGQPGQWLLNESGLAYSDDRGHTWTKDRALKWHGKSNFGQVAIVKAVDHLYFFGIPGGRFGGVQLARVEPGSILDKGAYRYFAGLDDGEPRWSEREEDAVLIASAPVGELSVMWNGFLGRWIMTYLDERRAAIVIREAPELWGPWSAPRSLVSGSQYPGLYGAYMHPWYVGNDGEVIYFTMSQWAPYCVFLMRARLARR